MTRVILTDAYYMRRTYYMFLERHCSLSLLYETLLRHLIYVSTCFHFISSASLRLPLLTPSLPPSLPPSHLDGVNIWRRNIVEDHLQSFSTRTRDSTTNQMPNHSRVVGSEFKRSPRKRPLTPSTSTTARPAVDLWRRWSIMPRPASTVSCHMTFALKSCDLLWSSHNFYVGVHITFALGSCDLVRLSHDLSLRI